MQKARIELLLLLLPLTTFQSESVNKYLLLGVVLGNQGLDPSCRPTKLAKETARLLDSGLKNEQYVWAQLLKRGMAQEHPLRADTRAHQTVHTQVSKARFGAIAAKLLASRLQLDLFVN